MYGFYRRQQNKFSNKPIQYYFVSTPEIWPIAKYLTKRGGQRAAIAINGLLGLNYQPVDKAKAIADCLENQFTPHNLCEENHEQQVEAKVQALLEAVDSNPPERIRPCDLQKLLYSLKLKEAYGIDGIPNECLRHLPTHLFNHCIRLSHFPTSWKEAKVVALPKHCKDPKFPQNVRPSSLLSSTGKVFEKVILEIVQKKKTSEKETSLTQVSLASVHVIARHCNV
jgi:hypothetical protein